MTLTLKNPLKFNSIWELLAAFLPVIVGVVGISLLGYLLYGAFLWLTSGDKPDQLESAKKTITNAVIGFALFGVMFGLFMFLSYVLQIDWAAIISNVP
jgi:multisubunit Na+/H+ antiporter MnhB subunit